MKKTVSLLLAVCMCLSIGMLLTSCGHKHTYETEWSKDETHHWYACEGEDCTDVADKAEHTWNDGEVTVEPTAEADGVKTFTCTICGQTKTEPVSFVMDRTIANRVYSLLGEENEGMISVAVNKDGLFLEISSHDISLEFEEGFGDIAKFEYDDSGKMTNVIVTFAKEESYPVTEYDENGRPIKVQDVSVFTYEGDNMTFTFDSETYYTFDKYGRCVHYKNWYSEYQLTFNGNVGTWNRVDENEECFYTVTYEKNTKLTKMEEWIAVNDLDYCAEYKYNDQGLVIEYKYIEIEEDFYGGTIWRHEYNDDGMIVRTEELEFENDTEIKENEDQFIYDSNKNLIEVKWLDPDGIQYGGKVYTYNSNGNLIKEETSYHPDNDIRTNIREYQYDENGNIKKEISIDKYDDGTERRNEYEYQYDNNGYITQTKRISITKDPDGTEHRNEEIY